MVLTYILTNDVREANGNHQGLHIKQEMNTTTTISMHFHMSTKFHLTSLPMAADPTLSTTLPAVLSCSRNRLFYMRLSLGPSLAKDKGEIS